ncbi:MAG: hypothetical protein GWP63_23175 [Haliea sp.]|jgi:peptidoglycan hydrolase-like protein with peptidoglycan-binding domain|nr:hypothetical protein [Haliea sp.]
MKNSLITFSVLLVFLVPQVSADSWLDKWKKKAEEILDEQEAKADQKMDKKIDETVDSAEDTVYGNGSTTSPSTTAGTSAGQTVTGGDNANPMLVQMAQAELKRLGYPVAVDGVYGNGTRNAILAFEVDHGRPLSGNVSPQLINALKNTPTPGGA